MFIAELTRDKDQFSYLDTLYPHPYLAFVHRKDRGIAVNNIGLMGRDFPYIKDPNKFVILFTGGSVANQFVNHIYEDIPYLEYLLKQTFDFDGKEVVVLNGGDGVWKQPQQTILFTLFADVIDAVITLDGFNEHYMFKSPPWARLEYPANNFHQVNPMTRYGYQRFLGAWMTSNLYSYSKKSWLIGRSRTVYFSTRLLRKGIQIIVENANQVPVSEQTTVETLFALPGEWTASEKVRFNLEQYKKYTRIISYLSNRMGHKQAFFIQPVRLLGKN